MNELLRRRRKQCIVARICYYCFDHPMVSDQTYDKWERELKELIKTEDDELYQEYCPTKCVGSTDKADYPLELLRIAEWLVNLKPEERRKYESIL